MRASPSWAWTQSARRKIRGRTSGAAARRWASGPHHDAPRTSGKVPVPRLDAPRADIDLSWRALTHGLRRGKIAFFRPVVNFVEGKGVDWRSKLKRLTPMRRDGVSGINGTVAVAAVINVLHIAFVEACTPQLGRRRRQALNPGARCILVPFD